MAAIPIAPDLPEPAARINWDRALDRLEVACAFLAVAAVAAFAAVISYTHIYDLGVRYSEHSANAALAARLLPLAIDGTIVAASLVLLIAARRGVSAPPLARWMLYAGIVATVLANVDYGAAWGPTGAVLWALPAAAFCGGVELLAAMVRLGTKAAEALAEDAKLTEALRVFSDQLDRGEVPSVRAIRRGMKVGQDRAKRLRGRLADLAAAG